MAEASDRQITPAPTAETPDRVHTLKEHIGSDARCRVQSRLADPHECWACKGLRAYGITCTRGACVGACVRNPMYREKLQARMVPGLRKD